MPSYAYAILAAGWLFWLTPFFLARRNTERPKELDRRARWGILLVVVAYSMLWQSKFWERSPPVWRVALAILFLLLAGLLSWTGARSLGRQWRLDAGLSSDHELVMTGPYRVVRHPIYTSMLCVLIDTGVMITTWRLLLISLLAFAAGTGIGMRVEDRLLARHFGNLC